MQTIIYILISIQIIISIVCNIVFFDILFDDIKNDKFDLFDVFMYILMFIIVNIPILNFKFFVTITKGYLEIFKIKLEIRKLEKGN